MPATKRFAGMARSYGCLVIISNLPVVFYAHRNKQRKTYQDQITTEPT